MLAHVVTPERSECLLTFPQPWPVSRPLIGFFQRPMVWSLLAQGVDWRRRAFYTNGIITGSAVHLSHCRPLVEVLRASLNFGQSGSIDPDPTLCRCATPMLLRNRCQGALHCALQYSRPLRPRRLHASASPRDCIRSRLRYGPRIDRQQVWPIEADFNRLGNSC